MSNITATPNSRTDDATAFGQLLDLLNIAAEDRISICSRKAGEGFGAVVPKNRENARRLALSTPYAGGDVWFSVNPVDVPEGYSGRGADEHVTRCVALFADIDFKAGGVPNPELASTVVQEIADALGQPPTAVVFSGHGGHAYWVLDPDDDAWTLNTDGKRASAKAAYQRFHQLCADIAARHGCGVDNVAQLSRILRVPGTRNYKDPDAPVEVTMTTYPYGPSNPLSYEAVLAALGRNGVPHRAEDDAIGGVIVNDPNDWEFGEQTSPYVAAMVNGWHTDVPRLGLARHNWLVCQATRLACAHRLGLITNDDHEKAVLTLEETFEALLSTHGERRSPTPGEVTSALDWGVRRAAALSDEEVAKGVGGAAGTDEEGIRAGDQLAASDGLPKLWRASDMKPAQPMQWLAKGNIPKAAVTLLVGDEGIGKSTFWVWLVAHITTGQPCPEYGLPARDPQDVILVVTEDDWSNAVSPRLQVAGVDLDRVHIVSVEDDGSGSPTFPDHMEILASFEITPALVVVDAWLDTVSSKLSVKDPQHARQALHPWKEYATTTEAAVLLLTHTNRVATANPRDKYGATAELRKTARQTLFALADSESDDCLIVGPEKSNNVARGAEAARFRIVPVKFADPTDDSDGMATKVKYVGPAGKSARDLIAEAHHGTGDDGSDDKLSEAMDWLDDYLTANGKTASMAVKKAAKADGISESTLKRASKKLQVISANEGYPRTSQWVLPGGIEIETAGSLTVGR
jgi:hypothetical protein